MSPTSSQRTVTTPYQRRKRRRGAEDVDSGPFNAAQNDQASSGLDHADGQAQGKQKRRRDTEPPVKQNDFTRIEGVVQSGNGEGSRQNAGTTLNDATQTNETAHKVVSPSDTNSAVDEVQIPTSIQRSEVSFSPQNITRHSSNNRNRNSSSEALNLRNRNKHDVASKSNRARGQSETSNRKNIYNSSPSHAHVGTNEQAQKATTAQALEANATPFTNAPTHSSADEPNFYDCSTYETKAKRKSGRFIMRFILLSSISFLLSIFPFIAVIYSLEFNYNLTVLEHKSRDIFTIEKYTTILQNREQTFQHTYRRIRNLENQLQQSQMTTLNLRREILQGDNALKETKSEIKELESVITRKDEEIKEAQERIEVLRGSEEDATSALDMAWLRMDELMEENNLLYDELKEAKKDFGAILKKLQSRDKDVSNMESQIESMKKGLTKAQQTKDRFKDLYESLLALSKSTTNDFEIMQHNHVESMNLYFAPLLSYVQHLQQMSEQQHSIILELTSLVHSLNSSLEISRSNLEIQTSESIHAVDAIAMAANELAYHKEQQYQLERLNYMEHMEYQLERLEEEALGAVQAVAEAAGKLEHERKKEEEGRWRWYIDEVEKVLGEIGAGAEEDMMISWNDEEQEVPASGANLYYNEAKELEYMRDIDGLVEKSVLRDAITRRIEEGILSLRGYLRPYNYFKDEIEDAKHD